MSKMVIHIGLHKTGTTFLQNHYFPNLSEISYCSGNFVLDDFGYDKKHNIFLISNESLSGRPWNLQWIRGIENDFRYINSFEIAINNIKEVFPHAIIVIVFRKHGDFLLSLYKQYIQEGGILNFKNFYNYKGVIRDKDLSFAERINFLKNQFEEVHVLSFEKFKSEGIDYYNRFFTSLGCKTGALDNKSKANSSISGNKIEILRKLNRYYPYTPQVIKTVLTISRLTPRKVLQEKLSFWKPSDSRILKDEKQRVNENFKPDWKRVESQFFK